MLHRLSASDDRFRPIEFHAGLNLIVAERAPDASEQDSRNARGKTSLLHALNYCLGGNRPTAFKPLAEEGWSFSLDLDLFGQRVRATRSLSGGGRIVVEAAQRTPPILGEYLRDDGTVSLADWKFLLGLAFFALDDVSEDVKEGISARTLLSYVVRLEAPRDPTKVIAQQSASSSRQHLAYLLGLDWRFTHDLSALERQEEGFKALKYMSEADVVPGLLEDEAELLMRREEAERELEVLRSASESFVVIEDHEALLAESDHVAAELTELNDEQVIGNRLMALYHESTPPPVEDAEGDRVEDLYRELGFAFTEEALRRLDEVSAFHQTLTRNRQRFLETEIRRLTTETAERSRRIAALQTRRQEILRELAAGGGLDDLLELQRRVADATARVGALDEAIQRVRDVSAARERLSVEQATKRRDARDALDESREFVDSVNERFSGMIRQLYDRSASVTVDVDKLGYKFSVKVSGSSSSGITRMKLLALDLTLMELSRFGRHPHFLAHDSVVYDGVDPRQVAGALLLGREVATAVGGQYIVTMNTNDVPQSVAEQPWYEDCVRRVILDTEVGGAFGVDF